MLPPLGGSAFDPLPQLVESKRRGLLTLTTIRDQLVLSALSGLTGHKSVSSTHGERSGSHQGERGRHADRPADIPAKGWKDIARRVYEGMQKDRVLLIAAGVTFYSVPGCSCRCCSLWPYG